MMVRKILIAGLLCLGILFTAPASADMTYGFYGITHNNPDDVAIGEAQLSVTVSDLGWNTQSMAHQVMFRFVNEQIPGWQQCTITGVYFDDGALLGIAGIDNSGGIYSPPDSYGVLFTEGATPPVLPGGNTVGFMTTAGFLADASNPSPKWGVSPGEWVGIVYDLQYGKTYTDVIDALILGLQQGPGGSASDGSLVIGIHVTNFLSGGSESFINVAAPGSTLLACTGLGIVGWMKRRRNSQV